MKAEHQQEAGLQGKQVGERGQCEESLKLGWVLGAHIPMLRVPTPSWMSGSTGAPATCRSTRGLACRQWLCRLLALDTACAQDVLLGKGTPGKCIRDHTCVTVA